MELAHLAISQLSVAAINMRAGRKAPDVSDLVPSVKARGVLVPLLVRAASDEGCYEIVAGRRRYHAVLAIAEEGGEVPLLPCAIMEPGDDAAALEASIIENVARTEPDEVTKWVSFTRLVREGRGIGQIAATFGISEPQVRRVLALGNLNPRIRDLYAKGEIDAATVRHLTMASKVKQAEWLALWRDTEAWAPAGSQLKHWLLGGQSIPTTSALFELAAYPDPIITDLFGEESYFSNAETFWALQGEAIGALRQSYLDAGWADVVVLEVGHHFQRWEHQQSAKAKGGKVFLTVTRNGAVEAHEGWLTNKEVRKHDRAEAYAERGHTTPAPELTSTLRNYCDLHRHAMVQAALVEQPGIALRLMAAHAIAGSWQWNVKPDPLRAAKPEIAESHASSLACAKFAEARSAVATMFELDPENETLTHSTHCNAATLFAQLLPLPDQRIIAIVAVVMAETLAVGSPEVEAAGTALAIDPLTHWQPDDTFLALLRSRTVLVELIGEVAGQAVAMSNMHERGKTLRTILADCLTGTNGRPQATPWAPRWLTFPAGHYLAEPAPMHLGSADEADEDAIEGTGIIPDDDIGDDEDGHCDGGHTSGEPLTRAA